MRPALAAVMAACVGAGMLGCGSEDEVDPREESSRALVYVTDAAKLGPRVGALAGRLADASSEKGRATIRRAIETLQGDASDLAARGDAELKGDLREPLYSATSCYEKPTEALRKASLSGPGREAEAAARSARREYPRCERVLRTVLEILRDEHRRRTGPLLKRVKEQEERADRALADLVEAVQPPAVPVPAAGQPAGPGPP